jgi:nitric oxide reductase NorQ protein
MYAYFNDTTGELIAFMPSNRGRAAKNHNMVDLYGAEISASLVPAAKVADFATAAEVKAHVTDNGPSADAAYVPSHDAVLYSILYAMRDVLKDGGHSGSKALQTVEDLINDWEPAGTGPADRLVDWCNEAGKAVDGLRRTVNSIMNDRGYGWFYTGAIPTETVLSTPAAKAEKEEEEEEVSYGFARMAGNMPKLNVVGKEEEEAANEEHGVFYPRPDKTYIINKQVEGLFKILEASSKKCPQNVNLIGPHGCGKTELAIQFAARLNRPLLIMDCANLREARDWFGYKTAKEGTVYWHESQFVRAIQAGNHVILLDELNRANPNLLNTLMPILDARRFTYLEERGDKIVVGPETVFFASMNEGAGYTGTSSLDRAIRDRFPRAVELTYLGEKDEVKLVMNRTGIDKDIATRLVQMANKIRQDATGLSATLTESMSTRQLLAAAHDFALGGVDTLQFTITNHFSPDGDEDSERVKVQSLIQGKFGDLMAAQAAAAANTGA